MNKGESSGGAPARARIEGVVKGEAYITGAAAKATAQANRQGVAANRAAQRLLPCAARRGKSAACCISTISLIASANAC
jgi:hypothetical protein